MMTQYLNTTGAFLVCDPKLLPDGPLSYTSELGLFNVNARVVQREAAGIAIEFTTGKKNFFKHSGESLTSIEQICHMTDQELYVAISPLAERVLQIEQFDNTITMMSTPTWDSLAHVQLLSEVERRLRSRSTEMTPSG